MSHISYMIYFFRVSEYKSLIFRKNYLIIVLKKAMKPKNAIKILIAMRLSNYQIIKLSNFYYFFTRENLAKLLQILQKYITLLFCILILRLYGLLR